MGSSVLAYSVLTDDSLPGCLGIIVTCTCKVLLYFCCDKRQICLSFLKKLFHSSTSHTYHHNSSWTIRQARNYLWSSIMSTYLTTNSLEPKILAEFVPLKLKTCWLYHENISLQKLWWLVYPGSYINFFSLWHCGDCQKLFPFLWCEWYLPIISVELKILAEFVPLKLKTCWLYHEKSTLTHHSAQVLLTKLCANLLMVFSDL